MGGGVLGGTVRGKADLTKNKCTIKEGHVDKRHRLLGVLGRAAEGARAEGKAASAGPGGAAE